MNQFSFIPLMMAQISNIKVRIAHSHISERGEEGLSKIINHLGIMLTNIFCNYRISCGTEASYYLFKNSDSTIIKNGINIQKFRFHQGSRDEIRDNLGIADNIVLGNVGRLTNQKNQIKLIKVFNEIISIDKRYRLVIIGSGELKDSLTNLVQKLKLSEYVLFIDSTNVIEKYYSAFDLFVLPSLYEGFPVCAVESQVNGIPCIFNNTFDHSSIFNENVKQINFEENDDVIAKEILNLKLNRIDNISNDLLNYDEKKSSQKLLSLYDEMIERECS